MINSQIDFLDEFLSLWDKPKNNMKNNLRCVTLTGADDTVKPSDLYDISDIYPDVEWGILIGSRHNWHRFPSVPWIMTLAEEWINNNRRGNFSVHICGKHLNTILKGEPLHKAYQFSIAKRCQLNFHGEKVDDDAIENINKAFELMPDWQPEVIFQLDNVNNDLMHGFKGLSSGLFDLSHGTGVLPDEWPNTDGGGLYGYAGGLGPENVKEQFEIIKNKTQGPFWIDMETKLYTGFQFDLDKCKSVLSQIYDK